MRAGFSKMHNICLSCSFKQTYQAVEGGVKQAARNVNSRFDFKGKAQQTKDRCAYRPNALLETLVRLNRACLLQSGSAA